MRRHAVFLPPALALATFIACDDSNSNNGDGGAFTFDGGNFEGSTPLPPPAPGDSGLDAADTGPLPVTVFVTSHGKPVTGIPVVAHDGAGAVLATNTTGADGKATFIGVQPSMVSALLGNAASTFGGHEIVTWLGVQPGDIILAQDVELGGAPVGIYEVSIPNALDGGNFYNGYVGACGGSGPPLPFQIYMTYPCVRPSNSVLVSGYDTNGGLLAYASKRAAPAIATDGGVTPVAVGAWTAPSTTNVIVSNVPPNGGSGFAHLYEIADDNGYDNQTAGLPDGSATPFATATGFADALQGGIRFQPNLVSGSTLTVSKRTAVAPTLTVDFATALPSISDATLDTTDVSRPSVTIQATGSLTTTDGGVFFLAYYPPGADFPDTWVFVTPPGTTTVKAPSLPASAAPWLPKAPDGGQGGTSFREPYVFFLETDTLPSYNEFRQGAGLLVPYGGAGTESKIILPKNGNLRITSFEVAR
jgi:hypothetical protein